MEETVQNIVNKIKELPAGTETSIGMLLSDSNIKYSLEQEMQICMDVIAKCKNENIILDFSKYADQKVGLPQNIPFIKK